MNPLYKLFTLIYPERCPYCGCLTEAADIACRDCYKLLIEKHIPITGGVSGFRRVSSFVYGGRIRQMIIRLKFRDRVQYAPQIAWIMAGDIREAFPYADFDIVTAVPLHKKDKAQRGYNQSELLAKAVARELSLPYLETLVKVKRTKKQHTLNYSQRKENIRGAFKSLDNSRIAGRSILLIDDITTSGATLSACCKALKRAKPRMICCATIADAGRDYPEETLI